MNNDCVFTPEEAEQLKVLTSKFCQNERDKGRCNSLDCAYCGINALYNVSPQQTNGGAAADEREYTVCVAVEGKTLVLVKANNFEEAKKKACDEVFELDFGPLEDIDWHALYAENENDERQHF